MKKKSLFIAIEGGDGSGKGTQSNLLVEFFNSQKKDCVLKVSFPRHGEKSALYVDKYLNGEYGQADDVPGDLASLPYAIDRFAASKSIRTHLKTAGNIVIADRYVASNLAHQGTKFAESNARHEYYKNDLMTEYDILGIPKPDINIVLLVPTSTAQLNVDKKDARNYTEKKRDIHEANSSHLDRAKHNYEELCELYPQEFIPIQCAYENGAMRPIDEIQTEILAIIDSVNK